LLKEWNQLKFTGILDIAIETTNIPLQLSTHSLHFFWLWWKYYSVNICGKDHYRSAKEYFEICVLFWENLSKRGTSYFTIITRLVNKVDVCKTNKKNFLWWKWI